MSRHCVLAVSATLLEGVYLNDDSFAWLRERQPRRASAIRSTFMICEPRSERSSIIKTWL